MTMIRAGYIWVVVHFVWLLRLGAGGRSARGDQR